MTLGDFFIVKAVITLCFAASFVLAPALLLSLYGVTLSAAGIFFARLLGAALLGYAVVACSARNTEDSEAGRAIVLGEFIHCAIGFIVALLAQLAGLLNVLGSSIVAIYLLLALGYGYFQFVKPSAS